MGAIAHGLEVRFAASAKGIDPGCIGSFTGAVDQFRIHGHEWTVLGENNFAFFHNTASLCYG
jgi:hypothetical protein